MIGIMLMFLASLIFVTLGHSPPILYSRASALVPIPLRNVMHLSGMRGGGMGGGSGEEVSFSLRYSRITDRLNTPHPCVQEEAPR